jgi:hypothetical protein
MSYRASLGLGCWVEVKLARIRLVCSSISSDVNARIRACLARRAYSECEGICKRRQVDQVLRPKRHFSNQSRRLLDMGMRK